MQDEQSEAEPRPEEGGAAGETIERRPDGGSEERGYEGAGVEEGGGYQRSTEGGGYERSGSEDEDYDPRREGGDRG